jgi:hypothetical protein
MSRLYDTDFNRWALEQATALKAGRWQELDLEHLAEEIEALSKSGKRAIQSHLERILFHWLKWLFQPEPRSESGKNSVADSRRDMQRIIDDSPSLKSYPGEVLERAYHYARRKHPENPMVDRARLPKTCPWNVAQVLDDDFWPEGTTD